MELIGEILDALFCMLCFVGACVLVGFGFRIVWILADKFHKWPQE